MPFKSGTWKIILILLNFILIVFIFFAGSLSCGKQRIWLEYYKPYSNWSRKNSSEFDIFRLSCWKACTPNDLPHGRSNNYTGQTSSKSNNFLIFTASKHTIFPVHFNCTKAIHCIISLWMNKLIMSATRAILLNIVCPFFFCCMKSISCPLFQCENIYSKTVLSICLMAMGNVSNVVE